LNFIPRKSNIENSLKIRYVRRHIQWPNGKSSRYEIPFSVEMDPTKFDNLGVNIPGNPHSSGYCGLCAFFRYLEGYPTNIPHRIGMYLQFSKSTALAKSALQIWQGYLFPFRRYWILNIALSRLRLRILAKLPEIAPSGRHDL